MASSQDTEITLGTGKMLVLFFGLVVLCGVFFGVGFSLGRNSVKASAPELQAAPPVNAAVHTPAMKPASSNGTENLTFYKAVAQDSTSNGGTEPAEPVNSAKLEPAAAPAQPETKPALPEPAAATSGSGYYVQVAAVTKQEDAEALVEALKKKQYQASANNNAASDKLYHVQIGPFSDIKDAEAMRAKLVGDGYNPILKR